MLCTQGIKCLPVESFFRWRKQGQDGPDQILSRCFARSFCTQSMQAEPSKDQDTPVAEPLLNDAESVSEEAVMPREPIFDEPVSLKEGEVCTDGWATESGGEMSQSLDGSCDGQSDRSSLKNTREEGEELDCLKRENDNLKQLHLLQQQLLETHQAQMKLLEADNEKWKMLHNYQDQLLSHMQGKLQTSVDEKRSLQEEIDKTRSHPEVQLLDGLQRNEWALEVMKTKVGQMRKEIEACQAQAAAQVKATLAANIKGGWKAACSLPYDGSYPVASNLVQADHDEFLFVEWLFSRSLAQHRHARNPEEWCPTPNVKVLQVEKVQNRLFLKRYTQRLEELAQERAGAPCPEIRDIKTRVQKTVTTRPFHEEVCPCPGSDMNEVLLFHGTTEAKIGGILNTGFDPRLAGIGTGAMFGHGSYFAHNASKCFRYARQGPGAHLPQQGKKLRQSVLVVRALLGNPQYQSTMCPEKRLPPTNCNSLIALTRAEGGCVDHREYVLYDRASILPLYVVEFEHDDDCQCCVCCA